MNIKLFTTHCPKCKILELKLKQSGIAYELCEDVELMVRNGFASAPVLCVDGNFLDFNQAINWIKTRS